jgi:hypothetical protein
MSMASLFIFSRAEQEGLGSNRRPIHFLTVHGVTQNEPYTILKVAEDTTTDEVKHFSLLCIFLFGNKGMQWVNCVHRVICT